MDNNTIGEMDKVRAEILKKLDDLRDKVMFLTPDPEGNEVSLDYISDALGEILNNWYY